MSATINAMTNEKHAKKGQYVLKQRTNNPSDSEAESSSPLFDGDVNTGLKDEVAKHLTSETINANTGTSRVTAKSLNRLLVLGVTTTVGLILLFAIAGKNDSQAASTTENLQISTTGHDSGLRVKAGADERRSPPPRDSGGMSADACANEIFTATLKENQVSLSHEMYKACCALDEKLVKASLQAIMVPKRGSKKNKKKAGQVFKKKFQGFTQVCLDLNSAVVPKLSCRKKIFEAPDFRSELDFCALVYNPNDPDEPDAVGTQKGFKDTYLDYCLVNDERIRYNRERKEEKSETGQFLLKKDERDRIEDENKALRKAKDQCVKPFLQTCAEHVIAYHAHEKKKMDPLWVQQCCRIGTIDKTKDTFKKRFRETDVSVESEDGIVQTVQMGSMADWKGKNGEIGYAEMILDNCLNAEQCRDFVQFEEDS